MKGCRLSSSTPCRFANVWFQMAQTLKRKAATVESQNTNLIARANSSSPKRALETVVPGDESPFKATAVSSVDGAKIQQNSETTKDLAKKSRLLSYHSAPIAGASVKAAPEDWRAVFPVVIGVCLRPSQTCKCTREYLFRTLQ